LIIDNSQTKQKRKNTEQPKWWLGKWLLENLKTTPATTAVGLATQARQWIPLVVKPQKEPS
jgi:hypothetical protein